MIATTAPRRVRLAAALIVAAVACSSDRHHSPVCGMALLVGPSLIQQQLGEARAILTDVPRGLPGTLPARVAGEADTARVLVAYDRDRLVLGFEGGRFPAIATDTTGTDSTVYGLLLVDDSTELVQGVLVYEGRRPRQDYPRLGTVVGGDRTVPLYGVRVNWSSVSNPRCPLLGSPVTP